MAFDPCIGVLIGIGVLFGIGCICSHECCGDCNQPTSSDHQQAALAKARAIAVQPI